MDWLTALCSGKYIGRAKYSLDRLESSFSPKHNITSVISYKYSRFARHIWQRNMTCLQRLLLASLIGVFVLVNNDDKTVASSMNHVVKNATTSSKKLQNETGRQGRNSRDRNSPKSQTAAPDAPSVKNGTTSIKLQREILNLLGLPRRPRISLNTRLHGRKMSAPRYMMDLYNMLEMNGTTTDGGGCCNNTATDSRAVGADTIMSYLNHSELIQCM